MHNLYGPNCFAASEGYLSGSSLPDGGSTSTKVEGELEVTITYVHGHEIADTI